MSHRVVGTRFRTLARVGVVLLHQMAGPYEDLFVLGSQEVQGFLGRLDSIQCLAKVLLAGPKKFTVLR